MLKVICGHLWSFVVICVHLWPFVVVCGHFLIRFAARFPTWPDRLHLVPDISLIWILGDAFPNFTSMKFDLMYLVWLHVSSRSGFLLALMLTFTLTPEISHETFTPMWLFQSFPYAIWQSNFQHKLGCLNLVTDILLERSIPFDVDAKYIDIYLL